MGDWGGWAGGRAGSGPAGRRPTRRQEQVAPLRVKAVGAVSLLVQVPWKPTVTLPLTGMEPL